MARKQPLVALILLGGAGTRLWPLSTEARPKQFLKLFGGQSLFQMTVGRAKAAGCEEMLVLTNTALAGLARDDLAQAGLPIPPLVLEPERRDSAPAIAAGVAEARRRFGPDAIIVVLPSDHLIETDAQFGAALQQSVGVASAGWLTTFSIPPRSPSTAFGYIERGAPAPDLLGAFAVTRFHEKPDLETATGYLKAGNFGWNSGMFIFSAETFAEEALRHMPDIWQMAEAAVAAGSLSDGGLHLQPAAFSAARKISVDFALLEKSQRVATVPASFFWSDIGSWSSVYEVLPKDADRNVVLGNISLRDCTNTLALAEGVDLALSGVSDMVVVATSDGTFAAPLARAADVKALREL